jgi:hypothetical protein
MRRRRHARLPPASGAAGGDTDALQTDVMRFMSIIGLCLMAVFALVQGIPVQEQEVQLDDLQRQLEEGRKALTDSEQASMQKEQDLSELRGRLLNTQLQLDNSRKTMETLKHQSQQPVPKPLIEKRSPPAPRSVSKKRSPPVPVEKPVPARQGFVLRFASDAALDRLVTAGSVKLYGMADRQAWRLSMKAGRPAVAPATFPGWFHEMSAVTVPAHYLHSLETVAYSPGPSTVVWGVQLPAATRMAIAALTKGQQGGALMIQKDGQVTLEE